ncbi:MAG: dockerin type I domain-containing protein [Candidatus Bathyarchaeia archaeon]
MNKDKALSLITLTIFLYSTFIQTPESCAQVEQTKVYVDPSLYSAQFLGEVFPVQVKIYWGFNITAFQFKLLFNKTLLQCVSTSYGNFFPQPPRSIQTITVDNLNGMITAEAQLDSGESPKSGNGILLTIYFNATYGTPYPQPKDSCTFLLDQVKLYQNWSPTPAIPLIENGNYQAPWAPPTLQLELNMEKNLYYFEENITITGSLRANGYLVSTALIGIAIYSPTNYLVISRALQTGVLAPPSESIEILEVTPCDYMGSPKSTFRKGSLAFFKITTRNKASESKYTLITINLFDSRNATLGVTSLGITLAANSQIESILSYPIEYEAATGQAWVFANAFTDHVKNGGVPYCQEKSATFTITGSSGGGALTNTEITQTTETMSAGYYQLTFMTPYLHPRGTYTVYVSTKFLGSYALQSGIYNLKILGDVNDDGKVGLADLTTVALAYGTKPGDPKWNPLADVNGDGQVGLADLVIVAINYGKTA